MLGGALQERSFIDHPHHIQTLAVRKTPETILSSLTLQACGRSLACRAQDLYEMVHPEPFSTGIPTSIKGNILVTGLKGVPIFNENKYIQARIPH